MTLPRMTVRSTSCWLRYSARSLSLLLSILSCTALSLSVSITCSPVSDESPRGTVYIKLPSFPVADVYAARVTPGTRSNCKCAAAKFGIVSF